MYSILIVDSDATCLAIAKSSLKSWNYQVTTANHPVDALCLLRQKPFDLVLADVHLPEMNGPQLLRCINKDYDIPVILMSEDVNSELIGEGLKNGAQAFLLKPIMVDAVREIWKFCELSKVNKSTEYTMTMTRSYSAQVPPHIGSSSATEIFDLDAKPINRTNKFAWTPRLHTRFVEVLLIIGYHKAIPKTILEVMNAPGVTREQVASHLQKYRKLVNGILDGKIRPESSKYFANYSYKCSSIVGGNPNLFLINQLREERRLGVYAPPISASLPLPRFNHTAGSSSMQIMNAMSTPTNYASSSKNVKTVGIGGGSATFQNAGNLNLGTIVGSSSNITFDSPIQNVNYKAYQTSYYNQNSTVVPQQNYNFTNGGANINNWFPSTNLIGPSAGTGTESIRNNFSEQSLNLGGQGSTIIFNVNNFNGVQLGDLQHDRYTGGSFAENQFANTLGKDGQLRAMQTDPNTGAGSLGTNQLGNTLTMNEQMGYIQPAHPSIGTSFAADQYRNTSTMNMNWEKIEIYDD